MEGHLTHNCPETISLARKEEVIIFTLPPNTTHHLSQGWFCPLKARWTQIYHEYSMQNPGKCDSFSELFSKAWIESMSMGNIVAGF